MELWPQCPAFEAGVTKTGPVEFDAVVVGNWKGVSRPLNGSLGAVLAIVAGCHWEDTVFVIVAGCP